MAYCVYRLYFCNVNVFFGSTVAGADVDLFGGLDDSAYIVYVLGGLDTLAQQASETRRTTIRPNLAKINSFFYNSAAFALKAVSF